VTLSEADLDRLESVAPRSAWAGDRVAFASHRETRTQAEMFHAPKAKPVRRSIVSLMTNDAFKALAHPLRRGIVERLAYGPTSVGEATGGFGVSKPTISRHVKVLEEAGVVARTIDGRTHQLSLDLDALGEAVDWIDRQRAIWGRMLDVVDDLLEEQKEAG
jgi:DNA-binding transcriptional ArsR family regulator